MLSVLRRGGSSAIRRSSCPTAGRRASAACRRRRVVLYFAAMSALRLAKVVLLAAATSLACSSSPPQTRSDPEENRSPVKDAGDGNRGPAPSLNKQSPSPCEDPVPTEGAECLQECPPPVTPGNDPPPRWRWFSKDDAARRKQFGCPICLPGSARILTPSGDVEVKDLAPGMTVVSLDASGRRLAARLLHVGSTPVAASHELVVIELEDGRVVRASEGHPLADGRGFGAVVAGDRVDGVSVRSVTRTAYGGDHTWDLVVDSATGLYFADGVPLASTLRAVAP